MTGPCVKKMVINNITIYGGGLIGRGWITHLICCDFPGKIALYDISEKQIETAQEKIREELDFLVGEGVLTPLQARERFEKVHFTTDAEAALLDADIIHENCPENMELKQNVMKEIEKYCREDTLIATSTSGMSATLISEKMEHPERLIGAHPYHPVYLLPLVELVRAEKTSEETVTTFMNYFKFIRKEPVLLKKEYPGYIASRLMSVLFRESTHIIQEGVATMEDVERAFVYGPGLRYGLVGINTTLQLAGGEHGLAGTLFGGIGTSGGNWMESFANFTNWPSDYMSFWQTAQDQMNLTMEHYDNVHGHNNAEIEKFRDRGLIKLLKHHGKL